ncbi:concanavalin A-like lectin/glucanase domain-containing protein [Phyllosticta citricarpa]|uniref:Concanavalin A-like lectin/glucanase domain-containing protein n=2 Tax=Phyllosticta TaxID=121621 RepID=A0ABR1M5J8_9PEZI
MRSFKLLVVHLLLFVASSAASPVSLMRRSNERSLEPRQNNPGKKRHCSDKHKNDFEVIPDTQYVVFNMMYNKKDIKVGSVCTVYKSLAGSAINWYSKWNLANPPHNPDTVKGYSFVGLTIEGSERKLSEITHIPVSYKWSFSTEDFKGNVVLDYMVGPKKGDSKTPGQAQELMLWFTWKNDQVPIGFEHGVRQKIHVFERSWNMYQGVNTETGITVTSLLAETQYSDSFSGNTKEWLLALAAQAKLFPPDTTWLNVVNGGVEPFWGTVTTDATIDMKVVTGAPKNNKKRVGGSREGRGGMRGHGSP